MINTPENTGIKIRSGRLFRHALKVQKQQHFQALKSAGWGACLPVAGTRLSAASPAHTQPDAHAGFPLQSFARASTRQPALP
jgi:hypothetical protein